jgi:LPXTG-site transpeptidase (sortase) family protein
LRLPGPLGRLPRLYAILAIPVAVFLVAIGISLVSSESDGAQTSPALSTSLPNLAAADFLSPTPPPPAPVATAVPSPAVASPEPPPNRADCDAIRGTAYESDAEQAWYQDNCAAQEPVTAVVAPVITPPRTVIEQPLPDTAISGGYDLIGSPDRLVIPRLGINAPVNYRGIGADGFMGDPAGPLDVVWYDFSPYQGLGGYPGEGGNSVIAGHVDYRTHGLAVFAPLRNIAEGDIIEYHRWDGVTLSYIVLWAADIPSGEGFNQYVAAGEQETMTLITCNGTFDQARREYDHRRVVRAARI